jgi:hypothetical protein
MLRLVCTASAFRGGVHSSRPIFQTPLSSLATPPETAPSSSSLSSSSSVLIVASRQDPAGLNLATALLERGGDCWTALQEAPEGLGRGQVARWIGSKSSSPTPTQDQAATALAAPPGAAASSLQPSHDASPSLSWCSLWLLDERLTLADDLDLEWEEGQHATAAEGKSGVEGGGASYNSHNRPSEIIFLSRHASASGAPSLTVRRALVATRMMMMRLEEQTQMKQL